MYNSNNKYKNIKNNENGNMKNTNFRKNHYYNQFLNRNDEDNISEENKGIDNNEQAIENSNNGQKSALEGQNFQKPRKSIGHRITNVKNKTRRLIHIGKFLMTHPYILIIVGVIIFIFIIIVLMSFDMFADGKGSGGTSGNKGESGSLSTYSNCDYITVDGVGQIEFEEYIAGVVTAESSDTRFPEAMKAQAVAARNYALYQTNNCTKSIANGEGAQVYKTPGDAGRNSANETAGEIMLDENNDIVPGYFASYPSGDSFDWSYGSCGSVSCSGDTCSTTLYKVPSGKSFTFTMDKYYDGSTWNGAELTNQGGHCYGMSQLGARYLDSKGYSYINILSEFYDFKTSSMNTGNGLIAGSIDGYTIRTTIPNNSNTAYTSENFYYVSDNTLLGQCTWYAHGRAVEILKNSGLSNEDLETAKGILKKMKGNAATWYDVNKGLNGNGFAYGSDPKPGSIIVWGAGMDAYNSGKCPGYDTVQYGHVGIVEDVKYDEDGNVKSLIITDGWKDEPWNSASWSTVNFQYKEWTYSEVYNYHNGCRPVLGYIYLLD